MSDTSPEVAERYRAMLMSKAPQERLRMASDLFDTAKAIILSTYDGPPGSEREYFFVRIYGSDFSEDERARILLAFRAWAGRSPG